MKKEIADKWVAALRSGKYKQGRGKLRHEDNFCCLGVLCEISGLHYDDNQIWLPIEIADWAGMKFRNGILNTESYYGYNSINSDESCLTNINDSGKYTFNDIADIIEKNWEKL